MLKEAQTDRPRVMVAIRAAQREAAHNGGSLADPVAFLMAAAAGGGRKAGKGPMSAHESREAKFADIATPSQRAAFGLGPGTFDEISYDLDLEPEPETYDE